LRVLIGTALLLAVVAACSNQAADRAPYGAEAARIGESLALLGWNISVSNLRWDSDHVLIDVDASAADPTKPHADAADLRFGLYGALAHPIEAFGIGSCADMTSLAIKPVAAPNPDHLTGTVCLGPQQDQSPVRGVYVYSPRDRIPGSAAAYPLAFPVGMLPTNPNDTGGLLVKSTSAEAWRADGSEVGEGQLGDPQAFSGNGYMLVGLDASGLAARYRDESVQRGGPMMIVVSPTLSDRQGLSRACSAYGASVLILPDAKLDAVHVRASLCTQGEINDALLYATLSVVGTHAAVWTSRD
jgi:hypothetical protein